MKIACLLVAMAGWTCTAAEPGLLVTIREGNTGALKAALRQGADANAADARGTTALHYAALYSTTEAMAALIEAGARVNTANRAGVTPLFTALGDFAKVRLLVEKGADVNVRSAAGHSPIRNAAYFEGGGQVVEYLLSKDAKADAGSLSGAVRRGNLLLVVRLLALDVTPSRGAVNSAAATGNPKLLAAILEKSGRPGAKPSSQSEQTALMEAAYYGPVESVRLLLEHGEEIDAKDNRGRTALMYAAGSDHSDPAVLKLLLDKGADAGLKDQRGDAALDFARARRDTGKVRMLGGGELVPLVPQSMADSPPPVRTAVERALRLFDAAAPAFFKANACISCHHQSIPQMAMAEAERGGLIVPNPDANAARSKSVLAIWRGETDNMWQTSCAAGGGGVATLTYGLVGLAAAKEPANPTIDAAVHCLSKVQEPDGSWRTSDERQPLGLNHAKYTALAIRALQLYPLPGLRAEFQERIARGRAFLEKLPESSDTQTLAFQLLGMKWAASPLQLIRTAAKSSAALQRADGGWAQQPAMASDAYATGQAVWALREGAEVARDNESSRRGIQYLRATQREDGSWHLRSRGFGFQPYRDTGFPYGHDQWISSAATGFAVIALAPLIEPVSAR